MKDLTKQISVVFALLLFTAIAGFAQTAMKAQVVGVVDGDTITVFDLKTKRQITIRLAGIDAPEKKQDYGAASKQKLSDLIFEKKVTVVIYKEDRYGRSIGVILLDGRDINLLMVEAGFAWHYKEYEKEQSESDRKIYAAAEITARSGKIALWSLPDPVKPSEFRRAAKAQSESNAATAPTEASSATVPGRVILPVPPTSGINSGSSSDDAGGSGKDKSVHVKGYTRKDGTVVAPYNRSKPNQ